MNKQLTQASLASLARHVGNLVAGALLTHGWINDSMTQQVVAVVTGLVILGWSFVQKRNVQVKGSL